MSGTLPSLFFSFKAARCSTPNLCCSSITTAPKELKETLSCIREWVPIIKSTLPSSSPRFILLRSTVGVLFVRRSTCNGLSPRRVGESSTIKSPKIFEIAIVVPDLSEAILNYKSTFNCKISNIIKLQKHGVTTAFINLICFLPGFKFDSTISIARLCLSLHLHYQHG